MRKSKIYFTAAIFVWAIGIIYSLLTIFGPKDFISLNKRVFSGFLPFAGFIFIFIGIGIARKGNTLYNLERGLPANYRMPRTKAQNTTPYITAVIFGLIAVVLIALTLSTK